MNKVYKDPKIAISTTDFLKPANFDEGSFNLTGTEYTPAAPDSIGSVEQEMTNF